ncbi:MAG: class I SAM-dependent methyltransferase [Rhodospirillales bacterium]|nr:class I SAM-dependent methyltransferase [Rhodospirillales bacterium]
MDTLVYETENKIEQYHWWFRARRELFADIVRQKLKDVRAAKVLDIGLSSGANMEMLQDMGIGEIHGVDFSDEAVQFCSARGLKNVRKGSVTELPFEENSFDLVLATDIIEHVDDHKTAIAEIKRVLKPSGIALLTVPAYKWMWSYHDDACHHKRRYTAGSFRKLVASSGMRELKSYYFNFVLLPIIFLGRKVSDLFGAYEKIERESSDSLINQFLFRILSVDIAFSRRVSPPFGVSFLMLCEKE